PPPHRSPRPRPSGISDGSSVLNVPGPAATFRDTVAAPGAAPDTKGWWHGRSQRGGTHRRTGRQGVGPAHRLARVRRVERDPHELPEGRPRGSGGGRNLRG